MMRWWLDAGVDGFRMDVIKQIGLAENGRNSLCWNDHDQPRAVARFGDDGAHRKASAKPLPPFSTRIAVLPSSTRVRSSR